MQSGEKPYETIEAGVRLRVRLTPRGHQNAVAGLVRDPQGQSLLHLRLKAPPVDGAANKALVEFLAARLKLRKSDIEISAGAKSRVKTLQIRGEPALLQAQLDSLLQAP